MRFLLLDLTEAGGRLLAHNVSDAEGKRVARKGRVLDDAAIEALRAAGRRQVHVVELEPGDVEEDEAAARIAARLGGARISPTAARTGRVNLVASELGVARIDVDRLERLNRVPGVALATVRTESVVRPSGVLASLKIVPYALGATELERALAIVDEGGALLRHSALGARRVDIILSGSRGARDRLLGGFVDSLRPRVEALGSTIASERYVLCETSEEEEAELELAIRETLAGGSELVLLAGETAIVDRDDVAPRAMERAGATVAVYGAPVDPGNLVAIAYRGEVPLVGMPGCARSPKRNVVDLILPRLLVGDRLDATDLARLGHGGLLEDVPERGLPRSWVV